jgi:hypothetical protein
MTLLDIMQLGGIVLGVLVLRQAFLPPLYRYRHKARTFE